MVSLKVLDKKHWKSTVFKKSLLCYCRDVCAFWKLFNICCMNLVVGITVFSFSYTLKSSNCSKQPLTRQVKRELRKQEILLCVLYIWNFVSFFAFVSKKVKKNLNPPAFKLCYSLIKTTPLFTLLQIIQTWLLFAVKTVKFYSLRSSIFITFINV